MKTILFKTATDAREYASANYEGYELRDITADLANITESDDAIDSYSGECTAYAVENEDSDILAILAYWETGEDIYELYVDGEYIATYNNIFDARKAARRAYEDSDDEDIKLTWDGEEIDF